MSLLYLSIATMFGVALGRLAWDAGLLDCHTPAWLWLAPLIALPATPLINRWTTSHQTLRWPASAGFRPPINGINWSIVIACVLALLAGSLRFASHPFSPCWTDEDLAYYNLPASSAFDASAPKRMVTGYISSYPLISDVKQRIEIEADAVEQGDEMRSVSGALTLNTSTRQRYSYGQPVQLEGRLATPPDFEDFSYSDYLARSGVLQRDVRCVRPGVGRANAGQHVAALAVHAARQRRGADQPLVARTLCRAGERHVARHRIRHPRRPVRQVQRHWLHTRHRHFWQQRRADRRHSDRVRPALLRAQTCAVAGVDRHRALCSACGRRCGGCCAPLRWASWW
jgi:hypothetical protein